MIALYRRKAFHSFLPRSGRGWTAERTHVGVLLARFPFTRTKGKILPLQLEQVEISVPIPKPVGGETRGKGGRQCSPFRREGTGQHSTVSSPLPPQRELHECLWLWGAEERPISPSRLGEGLIPRPPKAQHAGDRNARRTGPRLWPDIRALPSALRPQSRPRKAVGSRTRPRVSRRLQAARARSARSVSERAPPPPLY